MSNFFSIEGLVAGYNKAVVLHDITLTLQEGGTLGLLGRNGVGKTTLINSIVGLTQMHKGGIWLNSIPLHGLVSYRRARVGLGWVPQERNVFKSLTVHENLTCTARKGHWTAARVYEMFPRLAERRNYMGIALSGGEQQMLAIGRALTLNPTLLLLDEPTEGLAPIIIEELLRAIRLITHENGLSAIIVEQHPHLILPICDQAIILDRGVVVYNGAAGQLLDDDESLVNFIGVGKSSARSSLKIVPGKGRVS